MKLHWINKASNTHLLVFFSGWGLDEKPFQPITSESVDVLMVYDYRELDQVEELYEILNTYEEKTLLAWSMGVWHGSYLLQELQEQFPVRIALNGTPYPVHDQWGIPPLFFQRTIEVFDEETRGKFFKRMCGDRATMMKFVNYPPERDLQEQRDELIYIWQRTKENPPVRDFYTHSITCDRDFIFPYQSQTEYWDLANKTFSRDIEGSHFPFYRWNTWDEMIVSLQEDITQFNAS
ncbi:pimeloyl-ACP methyl esterase BioG family protein [Sediminitomix flava]|uniref:Biotin synthesis protein BioG n=1 Tax=Sediminitomix flava TaxID=379075 RepID=A0A315ZGZ3_SEDFL|nr:pimeloyl-ACP methyl esterase BioG family protein [Sediminitomix flava]PWJ44875.1 biotin synthesis protein BioG [Sediminitomix flava]